MVGLLAWSGSIQRSREVEGGRAILHGLFHGPDDELGLGQRVEELQQVRRHLLRQDVAEPLQQRLGALVVVSGVRPEVGNELLSFCEFVRFIPRTPYHLGELLKSDVFIS